MIEGDNGKGEGKGKGEMGVDMTDEMEPNMAD